MNKYTHKKIQKSFLLLLMEMSVLSHDVGKGISGHPKTSPLSASSRIEALPLPSAIFNTRMNIPTTPNPSAQTSHHCCGGHGISFYFKSGSILLKEFFGDLRE
jgi:hypothetical protein